jgi:hypothetical protein
MANEFMGTIKQFKEQATSPKDGKGTREWAAAPVSGCGLKCGSERREKKGPEQLGA